MSKIEVDAIEPQSGTALTVGASGDTITVPSGAILTTTNATVNLPATTTVSTELKTNKISPASGTAFTLGDSGDTFTVPAGATITNSGTATGFGGGKINQVIADIDTASRTTTSTSFVTASSSANVDITPSASSSKIYVVVTGNFQCNDGNDGWCATIYRDSTNLGNATSGLASGNSIPGVTTVNFPTTMALLDSPNTTSQITYQLYIKLIDVDGDGGNVNIGNTVSGSGNPVPTLITVFEVLA